MPIIKRTFSDSRGASAFYTFDDVALEITSIGTEGANGRRARISITKTGPPRVRRQGFALADQVVTVAIPPGQRSEFKMVKVIAPDLTEKIKPTVRIEVEWIAAFRTGHGDRP